MIAIEWVSWEAGCETQLSIEIIYYSAPMGLTLVEGNGRKKWTEGEVKQ